MYQGINIQLGIFLNKVRCAFSFLATSLIFRCDNDCILMLPVVVVILCIVTLHSIRTIHDRG